MTLSENMDLTPVHIPVLKYEHPHVRGEMLVTCMQAGNTYSHLFSSKLGLINLPHVGLST